MENLAFIWDLDGTLVDSYPAIIPATQRACAEFGLEFKADYIHSEIIRTSVGAFIEQEAALRQMDPDPIKARFAVLNDSSIGDIVAMPHAKEILRALAEAEHCCFIVTHRGESCLQILRQTELLPYFTEVVTSLSGFPRKPAPDAILYLIEKYRLSKKDCFYVGDRSLDIEAANNAGIGSILFLDPSSPGKATGTENYVISDLLEIRNIIKRTESAAL
jgi:phosphoglycolate phosphatase-like HAD superfamily hydrolase